MATKPDFVIAWTEPESAANTEYQPVYPYNNATQTKGGHSFEMDDTPTRERVRLQHGQGTFIEMHPNGDEVHKIVRDGYTITAGDHNISIGIDDGNNAKKLNITVYGDVNMFVTGNKTEQIDGNFEQHVKGNYTQTINGITTISSLSNYRILAGSSEQHFMSITTPHLSVAGDIETTGSVVGTYIRSDGRIDAGTGVKAGILGFVTEEGGVSVGIPVAVPGQIVSLGSITSFTGVSAPLGTFGLSSSVLCGDIVNELLRKIHTHIAPFGPTSPPVSGIEVNVEAGMPA
jgi:hypothetical protein